MRPCEGCPFTLESDMARSRSSSSWATRFRCAAALLLLAGLGACGSGGSDDGSASLQGLSCSAGDGTGWCWQRPQPLGVQVADVVFVDALHGWAAGDAGRVLRTVDGGRSWTLHDTGKGSDFALSSLAFADARQGWAAGLGWPDVLRTDDGGVTWTALSPAPMAVATSMRWLGERRLLVQGFSGYRLNVAAAALSEDGGLTWSEAKVNFVQADGTLWSGATLSTDFGRSFARAPGWPEDLAGVIVGGNAEAVWARATATATATTLPPGSRALGVSTDRGQTFRWTADELPPSFGAAFIDLPVFFAGGRGWAWAWPSAGAAPAVPITTADFGKSWQRLSLPADIDPASFPTLFFIDGVTALASGATRSWITRDAGATWADPGLPVEAGRVQRARRDGGGGLLVMDQDARWYRSGAGSTGWLPVTPVLAAAPAQRSLWFFDGRNGLALADDGALYGTLDGGSSWTLRTRLGGVVPQPDWLGFLQDTAGGLHFSGGTGWLVDGDRRLRRSTDGGASWAVIAVGNSAGEFVRSVQFIDPQQGFATTLQCEEGQPASCLHWLHVTRDAGGTWQRLPLPLGGASSLMAFGDAQRGVRMDERAGNMYFTTDGGLQWQPATDEADRGGTPHRVRLASDGTGWLLGNDGVRRTRDFGRSWQEVKVDLPPVNSLGIHFPLPNDIAFADAQHGWLVAGNGVVMATSDGGSSWRRQPVTTQVPLYTVFALDAQRAWIGGDRGVVLGTVTAGQ